MDANLTKINADIELTLTDFIRQELNNNSKGVYFNLGFWVNSDKEGTNEIQTLENYYSNKKKVVPTAIDVFDGEILPIEGLFNAEYSIPLTFQIRISDNKEDTFQLDVIDAINEVKNKLRGKLNRFEIEYRNSVNKLVKDYFTAVVTTNNLTPMGDIEVQKGQNYVFSNITFFFDISKDISYGNQVFIYLKDPKFTPTYNWKLTYDREAFDISQEAEPPVSSEGLIWRKPILEKVVIYRTANEALTPNITITDYRDKNQEDAKAQFVQNIDFSLQADGYIYKIEYGRVLPDTTYAYFYYEVSTDTNYEFYESYIIGKVNANEYQRVYPLSPTFSRNNITENIQNFSKEQAENLIQETNYTVSMAFILKEDNLHYQLLEDIIKKTDINKWFYLKIVWNWYEDATLKEKLTFEDRVVISDSVLGFGVGEEQSFVVTFKRWLQGDFL